MGWWVERKSVGDDEASFMFGPDSVLSTMISALYVPASGQICFSGEAPSDCVKAGEARWARPGYAYSNEGTLDSEGAEIIVLNTESGPNMKDASSSPTDFLSTHHISLNYVAHG